LGFYLFHFSLRSRCTARGCEVQNCADCSGHDIDLRKGDVHVCDRADKYLAIDAPKSEAGERIIPLLPGVVKALREWRLECPKGTLGIVFPTEASGVESHWTMLAKGLHAAELAAGICTIVKDSDGKVMIDERASLSGSRNTPACIRSGTSSHRGASIAKRTAASNSQPRLSRSGSAIHRSP
jgi:hypothetical protein